MIEHLLVGLVVAAAALHVGWRLMPARWRGALAARLGLRGAATTRAGGCHDCSACPGCPPSPPSPPSQRPR